MFDPRSLSFGVSNLKLLPIEDEVLKNHFYFDWNEIILYIKQTPLYLYIYDIQSVIISMMLFV